MRAFDENAERAGDHEGERHRDQQRIIEQSRIMDADGFLHGEGDVSADHHHLAMRHVDDAHHAEGDGKADGGEQQHRSKRQAVPGILHRRPHRQIALDRGDAVLRALHDARRRIGGQSRQDRKRFLVAARLQHAHGFELFDFGGIRLVENDGGARFAERALDPGIAFLGERRIERRKQHRIARLEHGLRGFQAFFRIGREQRQAAKRGLDRAAQPVVDADLLDDRTAH